MNTKLYVGNLPYSVTESALRELFAPAGEIASVAVITDRVAACGIRAGMEISAAHQPAHAVREKDNLGGMCLGLDRRNLVGKAGGVILKAQRLL